MSQPGNVPAYIDRPGAKKGIYWRFNRFLERHTPRGIYGRSLIIVVAPIVLLQSIMAFIIMERHWDQITKRLSRSVARDMAFVVAMYEASDKSPKAVKQLVETANATVAIGLTIRTGAGLPPPRPKPFFSLLDYKLSQYVARKVGKPFWIDTIGQSGYVDVRIQVAPDVTFRFLTKQERAYATSTIALLAWLVGSSVALGALAIFLLRNQVRPIQQLAEAAQSFGMGRDVKDFYPRGAREVQTAAVAFLKMKNRIERHVEQRTAMLAGVSHDLRTILTRLRLELAFLGENATVVAMKEDIDEMQHMLEGYMAFVRGDGGEKSAETDVEDILTGISKSMARTGHKVALDVAAGLRALVKPNAFKRCIANLVSNATRYASQVKVRAYRDGQYLFVVVEDDGPGIDADKREDVFRPFVRLDDARNQNAGGTGLGLAIAQDIAHSHGGEITLEDSPSGGLLARVRIPV